MNRRSLLVSTGASVALGALNAAARTSANSAEAVLAGPSDGLNPAGIRIAGIRMVAVAGGKYKVWTKKFGSGGVKVLLLHGGPGFSHEYLEAFESFLPQAGIEMYYYDQLGCNNSDQPDDPALDASSSQRQIPAKSGRDVQPVHSRLDQLLRQLLPDAVTSDPEEDRSLCHPLGAPQI